MTLKAFKSHQALLFAEKQRQDRIDKWKELDHAWTQSRPQTMLENDMELVLVRVRKEGKWNV